jgi:hypothetical protein
MKLLVTASYVPEAVPPTSLKVSRNAMSLRTAYVCRPTNTPSWLVAFLIIRNFGLKQRNHCNFDPFSVTKAYFVVT